MSRALRTLAIVTTIVMYMVLLQGTLVTNTGSAQGCGAHWPLCNGEALPTFTLETAIEFGHRAITGLASILVPWLAVWAWRRFPGHPTVRWMAPTAVFFLVLQAALGAMAVLWPQPKLVLALHFGISLVSFASVLLLAMVVLGKDGSGQSRPVSDTLRRWAWIAIGYVYVVVYTGAYVRHTGSELACLGWPLCSGKLWPVMLGETGINFAHRLAAAGAVLFIGRLAYLAYRERAARPDLYAAARVALALVLLQAAAGAAVVLSLSALSLRMLHSAIVMLLFGALSYVCLLATHTGAPATVRGSGRAVLIK